MVVSAGCLLYKIIAGQYHVLLIHPKGGSRGNKFWGIPKGHVEMNEQLEETARRETYEEVGIVPDELFYLGSVKYTKTKKTVYCYVGRFPENQAVVVDNIEVDDYRFFKISEAVGLIFPDQLEFLLVLENLIVGSCQ